MVKNKSLWSQVVKSTRPTNMSISARNLQPQDLGAVIFGCTNNTIAECHSWQLFGLPRAHISYVRNIKEGLRLFLFNYDDRRLYGIYEAAGSGKFCPESNAWSNDGQGKTSFPAQRFSLAGVALNGVIYAVGGFNGAQYLSSAERLDPREPNWKMLPMMNARRGCHTLAVLNEKIFSIGGYDTGAKAMVATVEMYEPRMPSWVMVEPMSYTRGYHSSAVLGGSIFTFGGVKGEGDTILDVVERYKEGCGWVTTGLKSIGKRCYCSAIVH